VSYDLLRASESFAKALPHERWFSPMFDDEGEERVTIEDQEQELRDTRTVLEEALAGLWRAHVLSTAILDATSLLALVEFRRRATYVGRQRRADKADVAVAELKEGFELLAEALRNGSSAEELTSQTKKVIGVDATGRDASLAETEAKIKEQMR